MVLQSAARHSAGQASPPSAAIKSVRDETRMKRTKARANMIGNFMTRLWVKKLGIEMMTLSGSLISLVSMFALLGFDFLGWMHPLWIALPSMIYGISAGLVIGNGSMGAVYAAGHLAGSASGMLGAVQMGLGVLSGSLVVLAGGYENFNHGIQVLIGFSLVSVIFSMMTSRQKTVEAI